MFEWIEEIEACMRAQHLSQSDQAFFLFDHLEGEAREELKYHSNAERGPWQNTCHLTGAVWVLRVLCCSSGGFLLQEAAGGRDSSGVLPGFDGPYGESEAVCIYLHAKC